MAVSIIVIKIIPTVINVSVNIDGWCEGSLGYQRNDSGSFMEEYKGYGEYWFHCCDGLISLLLVRSSPNWSPDLNLICLIRNLDMLCWGGGSSNGTVCI